MDKTTPQSHSALAPGLRDTPQDALLWVKGLVKDFELARPGLWRRGRQVLRAVDEVSFDIRRGETFGLVGESGCGKSTVARCILRLLPFSDGEVFLDGIDVGKHSSQDMRSFRRRMQIVFQDPYASLDPRMSVREIVEEPLLVHGVTDQEERLEKTREILSLVGIRPEEFERKPYAFSGGQRQRIGIARAMVLHPDLVILDEPVSALDVSIQAQVLNLLRSMQERLDLTYLFIVHDLIIAEYFCDRLAVLYLGAVMEMADGVTLFNNPLHPYTVTLLSAVPVPDPSIRRRQQRIVLKGEVDIQSVQQPGCRFRLRCPVGRDRDVCKVEEPLLTEQAAGHWVACHFPGEIALSTGNQKF